MDERGEKLPPPLFGCPSSTVCVRYPLAVGCRIRAFRDNVLAVGVVHCHCYGVGTAIASLPALLSCCGRMMAHHPDLGPVSTNGCRGPRFDAIAVSQMSVINFSENLCLEAYP